MFVLWFCGLSPDQMLSLLVCLVRAMWMEFILVDFNISVLKQCKWICLLVCSGWFAWTGLHVIIYILKLTQRNAMCNSRSFCHAGALYLSFSLIISHWGTTEPDLWGRETKQQWWLHQCPIFSSVANLRYWEFKMTSWAKSTAFVQRWKYLKDLLESQVVPEDLRTTISLQRHGCFLQIIACLEKSAITWFQEIVQALKWYLGLDMAYLTASDQRVGNCLQNSFV